MGSDEEGEESEDEEDDEELESQMQADRNSVLITPGGVSLQSQPKTKGEQITRGQDLMASRKDERQTDLWQPSSVDGQSERPSLRSKQQDVQTKRPPTGVTQSRKDDYTS